MSSGGGFFAIDFRTWNKVCNLGVNPAVGYLILARGSGGDNRTTSWSVNAIETYTGMSRPRAATAIKALIEAGIIRQLREGKRPQYELLAADEVKGIILSKTEREEPRPDWIWMPNSIVDGLSGETPPVEILRQAQNPTALRHFGNLYHLQDLRSDGGVDWRPGTGIRLEYTREKAFEHGAYNVWHFPRRGVQQTWHDCEVWRQAAKHSGVKGEALGKLFWAGINVLVNSGLLEFVEHLVDSDDAGGEVIHPLPVEGKGEPLERALSAAATTAALYMLPAHLQDKAVWMRVPVLRHIDNVQLIGIGRLRYRPNTKTTIDWLGRAAECEKWTLAYNKLRDKALGIETEIGSDAISR